MSNIEDKLRMREEQYQEQLERDGPAMSNTEKFILLTKLKLIRKTEEDVKNMRIQRYSEEIIKKYVEDAEEDLNECDQNDI